MIVRPLLHLDLCPNTLIIGMQLPFILEACLDGCRTEAATSPHVRIKSSIQS